MLATWNARWIEMDVLMLLFANRIIDIEF